MCANSVFCVQIFYFHQSAFIALLNVRKMSNYRSNVKLQVNCQITCQMLYVKCQITGQMSNYRSNVKLHVKCQITCQMSSSCKKAIICITYLQQSLDYDVNCAIFLQCFCTNLRNLHNLSVALSLHDIIRVIPLKDNLKNKK